MRMMLVGTGAMLVLVGTWRRSTSRFALMFPVVSAFQPITAPPVGSVRKPRSSKENEPARVKSRSAPASTMKKPSPVMATSVDRPVSCRPPWLKLRLVAATLTPRPTCWGLMPAVASPLPLPPRSCWASVSANCTRLALKPMVLTLAMLLATTSVIVWWARSPETPANMERIMVVGSFLEGRLGRFHPWAPGHP